MTLNPLETQETNRMKQAHGLIKRKRYQEARDMLKGIEHPTARKWRDKLDGILLQADDPFAEVEGVDWDARWEKEKRNHSEGRYSQTQVEMAQMQSFTTKAIVVLILYFVLFIPGFIANWLWHGEGKRAERIAGHALPGVGMLGCLWWFGAICLGLTILGIVLLMTV
jgi:hypothetical protein